MFKNKVTSLPGHIQSVYVQNITKLYAAILVKAELAGDQEKIRKVGQLLLDKLVMFVQSSDLEVQERVSFYGVFRLPGDFELNQTARLCNGLTDRLNLAAAPIQTFLSGWKLPKMPNSSGF